MSLDTAPPDLWAQVIAWLCLRGETRAYTGRIEARPWTCAPSAAPDDAANLSPAFGPAISSASPRPLEGAFSRGVVTAGRGAAPAGFSLARKHPGGSGAPPGTTRSPCQELAEICSRAQAGQRPIAPRTKKSGTRCRMDAANDVRSMMRMWRAARRPPCPATDTDAIGLRLSARHPPSELAGAPRRDALSCP